MSTREKEVLNLQLTLIPLLSNAWKLSYIDVCYENYNLTGNQGIIDDIKDYIEMQGGNIA